MLGKEFHFTNDFWKLKIYPLQLRWFWHSSSAGHHSTLRDWCSCSWLCMDPGAPASPGLSTSYSWFQVKQQISHQRENQQSTLCNVLSMILFSGTFYYFNSIINPVLYSIMSKRFRRAFTELKADIVCKLCLAKLSSPEGSSEQRIKEKSSSQNRQSKSNG